MKTTLIITAAAFLAGLPQRIGAEAPEKPPLPASGPPPAPSGVLPVRSDAEDRADRRYQEMLGKMQAAVEEIAQLYGNPVFLQVFTNDEGKASELKQRLHATTAGEQVRRELSELQKKRDDLLGDIALKARESSRLTEKLVRQRAALDAVASAVEDARRIVEESSK